MTNDDPPISQIHDPFAQMSRDDKRFNYIAATIDAIGWPLGAAFFSVTTILPVYLHHLGATNALIGLLNAVLALLTLLPGLFVVPLLNRQRYARPWLFIVALLERFALLPLAFLTPLWGNSRPEWLICALFACFIAHGAFLGVNQPAYFAVIGKTVPPRWRGRLYGFAGGIAGLLGIGLDWAMRHVVFAGPGNGFPNGFGNGFLIGFLVLTISVLPLGLMREPPSPPTDAPNSINPNTNAPPPDLRAATIALWNTDAGFRRLLLSQVAVVLGYLATPFFVLHAQTNLRATGDDVARYTTVTILAAAFGNLALGALADARGNRFALLLSAIAGVVGAILSLVVPNPGLFTMVFVLNALSIAGFSMAGTNLAMEFAGDARKIPLYTAVYNAVIALPRAGAPLIGGVLADAFGYRPLFVLLLLLTAATLWLVLRVPEPRGVRR